MTTIQRTALVPFSAAQMYELVNDIERYPEFLPWCSAVDIDARNAAAGTVDATLHVAKGPIRQQVSTRNLMIENQRIGMNLKDGPFRALEATWLFDDVPGGGCQVSFNMAYEFKNFILQKTLGIMFDEVANTLVDAFCKRARALYPSG